MWLEHTAGVLLALTQHPDTSLETELKFSSSETNTHSLTVLGVKYTTKVYAGASD